MKKARQDLRQQLDQIRIRGRLTRQLLKTRRADGRPTIHTPSLMPGTLHLILPRLLTSRSLSTLRRPDFTPPCYQTHLHAVTEKTD
jgi:hypothetical protein